MKMNNGSLAELTKDALRILYSELGLVDTIRFITQFTTGYATTLWSVGHG